MQNLAQFLNYFSLPIVIAFIIYRHRRIVENSPREEIKNANQLIGLSIALLVLTIANSFLFFEQGDPPDVILLPFLFLAVYGCLIWTMSIIYRQIKTNRNLYLSISTFGFLLYMFTVFASLLHFENVFIFVFPISLFSLFITIVMLIRHKSFKNLPKIWKYVLPITLLLTILSYNVIQSAPNTLNSSDTSNNEEEELIEQEETVELENTTDEVPQEEVEEPTEVTTDPVDADTQEKIFDQDEKYYASYKLMKLQDTPKTIELAPSFFYTIEQLELGEVTEYRDFVKEFMFGAEPRSVLKVTVKAQNKTNDDYHYSFASTFINNGIREYSPVGKFTLTNSYEQNAKLTRVKSGVQDRGSFYVFMEEPTEELNSFDFLIGLPTNPETGETVDSSEDNSIQMSFD